MAQFYYGRIVLKMSVEVEEKSFALLYVEVGH
jgi:hypothetical protein